STPTGIHRSCRGCSASRTRSSPVQRHSSFSTPPSRSARFCRCFGSRRDRLGQVSPRRQSSSCCHNSFGFRRLSVRTCCARTRVSPVLSVLPMQRRVGRRGGGGSHFS